MKTFPVIILVMCSSLFSGCTAALLLPKDFLITEESQMKGHSLLLKSVQQRDPQDHWSNWTFMKVVAKNEWKSQTARLFTPIPESSQQIQFAFNLKTDGAFLKFLDGEQRGTVIGIEQGKTYFVVKGQRQEKSSKRVNRYLPPVKNYFVWPYTIHNSKNVVYLGEADHGLRKYHKIFASTSDDPADSQGNQYVIWINRQTLQIEYIEFTLNELQSSYKGVVHYREFRDVDGVSFAHDITLLDAMDTLNYSHKFYVQILSLE